MKILSLKQVSEILGVTPRTVQHLIQRGELHGFRVGERTWKVEEEEVQAYIQRQKRKAEQEAKNEEAA